MGSEDEALSALKNLNLSVSARLLATECLPVRHNLRKSSLLYFPRYRTTGHCLSPDLPILFVDFER